MKTKVRNMFGAALLVLLPSMAVLLGAATFTKQNTRVASLHIDTTFTGGTGTATAVKTYVYLEQVLVNDADANDIIPSAKKVIAFDMLDAALNGQTITAAGKTVTYPQLAALLRQASLDQANAQGVP